MDNYRFTDFKKSAVFYRVYGTGRAVVLIHGFGEDGNIWNNLAEQLQSNFMVIVPDMPGSGKSRLIDDQYDEVDIDDYAEAVIQIIRSEALTGCTIIGHSMGGYITLAIAAKYPGMLNGFGLFHSTAFSDNDEKKRGRLKSIKFIEENGAFSFLKTSVPALFADRFRQDHPTEISVLIDSLSGVSSAALIQYSKAMMNRPQRINVLETTKHPVLFIIGEEDPAVPLEKSLAQCHLPLVSYVHILPGVGHMGMLEEKDLSTRLVSAYLDHCWC